MLIDWTSWFVLPQFVPPLAGFLAARVVTFPSRARSSAVARLRICAGVTRIRKHGITRAYAIHVDPERGIAQATTMRDGIIESQVTTGDADFLLRIRQEFDQDVADLIADGWREEE